MASYLLRDVYVNNLKLALVITGDSDLATPIKFATEFGALINLLIPGDGLKANSIASAASNSSRIDLNELSTAKLPDPYILKTGSKIFKPKIWG